MAFEDDLGWEYFGNDPANSPRMKEHLDWHMAPENMNRTGNYGERFLVFHQHYIAKFDAFRRTKGLRPVAAWDPATKIAAALVHAHVLHAGRQTDDPSSVDPHCKTPSWATVAGGTVPDPVHGYTKLTQFTSLDELGRSIDAGWHATVHNTVGGDMSTFDSPIDPVFWRWHKWVDHVRATWAAARARFVVGPRIAAISRLILSGAPSEEPSPTPESADLGARLHSAEIEQIVAHISRQLSLGSGDSDAVRKLLADPGR